MADTSQAPPPRRVAWLRELVVPLLMLGGIGVFAGDSLHLSVEAMLLPAGLIVVIVAALLWALAAAFRRPAGADAGAAIVEGEDEAPGPILNPKAWLLVALPAVLLAVMSYAGALIALVALVFGAQLVFSARSPFKSLGIAVVATLPIYALFKYVLYVRFPVGLLGIG